MHTPTRLALIGALGLAIPAYAQQVINYDFSAGAAAVTTDFSNNGPSAGSVTWFGTGGVGNSAFINNFGTQPSLVYNTALNTAGVVSFNTSVFVRSGTVTNTGNGSSFLHLGFADVTGANLRSDEALSNLFALRFVGGSGSGELSWFTRTATPAGSAANAAVPGASNFSIASDTWYRFDATFTKGAPDIWDFSASVASYGANGTALDSIISTASGSFAAQPGTYGASTLYGAVMFRGAFGPNFTSLDNYSIVTAVPEPSSAAVLAGFGVLALVASRRRQR